MAKRDATQAQIDELKSLLGLAKSAEIDSAVDASAFDRQIEAYARRKASDLPNPYILAINKLLPVADYIDNLTEWHAKMATFANLKRDEELALLKLAKQIDPDYLRQTLLPWKRHQRRPVPHIVELVPDDHILPIEANT